MKANVLVAAAAILLVPACSNGGDGSGGGPVGGGGGAPALTSADMPGVSPCPSQTILTDAAAFNAFQAALLGGTYLYLDVPFDGGDPNIYRKKCGLGNFWNPGDNTDEIAPPASPVTISDLLQFGNAGICAAGFDNGSFGTGEGFPVAGTYRKEFKVAHMGTTYLVRVRVSVTGPAAGDTFASRSISVPTDIENTLAYEVDGTPQVHDDVLVAVSNALTSPGSSAMLDVLDAPGGATLLSALVEVLCVEIL